MAILPDSSTTVGEYIASSSEDMAAIDLAAHYVNSNDTIAGKSIDIMSDAFTFLDCERLKGILRPDASAVDVLNIVATVIKVTPNFLKGCKIYDFLAFAKNCVDLCGKVMEIETKMLTSQVPTTVAGVGEERLQKYGWLNIVDPIAERYGISPFVVLSWGWYDVLTFYRYRDTRHLVEHNINNQRNERI